MSASAVVRQATPDDIEPVAHLFDQYRQFYRRTSDLAAARAFIGSRLQNGDSIIFVIQAEPAGALVGFTQLYPLFASLSIGRAFVLNDLFVSPVARGWAWAAISWNGPPSMAGIPAPAISSCRPRPPTRQLSDCMKNWVGSAKPRSTTIRWTRGDR